jgi:hypothetical protein
MYSGNYEWKRPIGKLGMSRRIILILEWILNKWCWKIWTGLIWLRIGYTGGIL